MTIPNGIRILKRLSISLLGLIYCFSTTASGFQFWGGGGSIYDQSASSPTHQDLVAIVVDQEIYDHIQENLQRYVTTYIATQAPDIQPLILPIEAGAFSPDDIHRMLENLYFEGSRSRGSTLKGVFLMGDIPLPSIAIDDQIIESVYPYVDLERPMFAYRERSGVYEFTGESDSLPELWHSTLLSTDTDLFDRFFDKVREYFDDPTAYADTKIWYDNFPELKQSFTPQELDRYINSLLFADAHESRHVNSAFSRLINRAYEEGMVDTIRAAQQDTQDLQRQSLSDETVQADPGVAQASDQIFVGLNTVLDRLDPQLLEDNTVDSGQYPIPTKLLETQMQDEFASSADVFGAVYMQEMLDAVGAGGRYQLQDIDTSLEKIDILDRVSKAFVGEINETLANGLDAVVDANQYALKYPLPYRHSTWRKPSLLGQCGGVFDGEVTAVEERRLENHYFGRNAVDVVSYEDLSIYRGTYANHTDISTVRTLPYEQYRETLDDLSGFDMQRNSMGASLGFNSVQTQNNRAFNFSRATQTRVVGTEYDYHLSDKDIYDAYKCDDDQSLEDFSELFWGGASIYAIDGEAMQSAPRIPTTASDRTDRDQARNPTTHRGLGGPRYDLAGAVLVSEEISPEQLHVSAHSVFASPVVVREDNSGSRLGSIVGGVNIDEVNDVEPNRCEPRKIGEYDDIEFFEVYENVSPSGNNGRVGITVQPGLGYADDGDSDGIAYLDDDNQDGGSTPDSEDLEQDGDRLMNDEDPDIDGDGIINARDPDIDGDSIPNAQDTDVNGDGITNTDDDDDDGDFIPDGEDQSPQGVDEPPIVFDPDALSSLREDRGDHACFAEGEDYRYQIIDTVVRHRHPLDEDVDQVSTLMTFERPIDDNPYLTFHGIGGSQVTMIYPDLYNIPIYECNLMQPDEIEDTITTYLREKVQRYNGLLDAQATAASGYYATSPGAFDFLGQVDPSASPDRTYELIEEDFFVDLVGSETITRLAHHLHYLSTGWIQKPQAQTVGEFLELSREYFDYNARTKFVLEHYLTVGTGAMHDDPLMVPTRIESPKAYEVGVIYSDGIDTVGLGDQSDEVVAQLPEGYSAYVPATPGEVIAQQQGQIQDEQCGIKGSKAVPLLQRPKAMQCWFDETRRNPFDFSIDIEIDYDESFGPSYQGQLGEWFNKGVDAVDTTYDNFGGSGDASQKIQNFFSGIVPGVHAQQPVDSASQNSTLRQQYAAGSSQEQTMRDLQYDVHFEWDTTELTTIDSSQVVLQSLIRGDGGVRSLEFSQSAGDQVCLTYQGNNLCTSSSRTTRTYEPQNIEEFSFGFGSDEIGQATLQIKICDDDICAWHEMILYRGPGELTQVSLLTPGSSIVAGVTFPVLVQGTDRNGNQIPRSPLAYRLIVENGSFSSSSQVDSRNVVSFQDAVYEVTPGSPDAPVVLRLEPQEGIDAPETEALLSQKIIDVQGIFDQGRDEGQYTLGSADEGFMRISEGGEEEYNTDLLPTLKVQLIDQVTGNPVTDVTLPLIVTHLTPELGDWGTVEGRLFTRRDTIVQPSQTLQFLPSGQTGEGRLRIETVNGQLSDEYTYSVNHGELDQILIAFEQASISPHMTVGATVHLQDSRGNAYRESTTLEVSGYGGVTGFPERVQIVGGSGTITGETIDMALGGVIVSEWTGISDEVSSLDLLDKVSGDAVGISDDITDIGDANQREPAVENGAVVCEDAYRPVVVELPPEISGQLTASAEITIDQTLWAQEDLNIMYLHLGGKSWGDDQRTLNHIKNSKTLAISTTKESQGSISSSQNDVLVRMSDTGVVTPMPGSESLIGNLILQGGDISIALGHHASIGSYRLGAASSFDYINAGGQYGLLPNKLVYTGPGDITGGQLMVEGEILVDFLRSEVSSGVQLRPLYGSTNQREVMTPSGPVGTLWLYRGASSPSASSIRITHPDYTSRTQGGESVLIYRDTQIQYGSPAFVGREGSNQGDVEQGWTGPYAAINNFSQGQPMGQATLGYSSPYHLNIGDPFLMRVQPSRTVLHTDFDQGQGIKVFSDTQAIQDVDIGDIDNDGLLDMIVTSANGTIKLLYNEGGVDPYSDWGSLVAIADGIDQVDIGDTDGDGRDDLIVRTTSQTMRVYRNIQGRIDVNGTPVCLDIPMGEYNIAQASQLFVTDLNDSGSVDIITYDSDGDLKVFYGGTNDAGASYLSTDAVACDPNFRSRQDMQLIKSFEMSIDSSPVRDETLRHREGLQIADVPAGDQDAQTNDTILPGSEALPDFQRMSQQEINEYTNSIMQQAIDDAQAGGDPQRLYEQIDDALDYVMQVPAALRPADQSGISSYGGVRAVDPYTDSPRFDVDKVYTDINGGTLRKGDLVRVQVTVTPVGYTGRAVLRDKIPGAWIVYKNDENQIVSFDPGSLELQDYTIDWTVSNGYEYMLDIASLNQSMTYGYELQYNGDGHMRIEVETTIEDLFKGASPDSFFGKAYAQSPWTQRVRAYPQDGCYDQIYEFDPNETLIDRSNYLQQQSQQYDDHVQQQREQAETLASDPSNVSPIEDLFGVPSDRANMPHEQREELQLGALLAGVAGGGGGGFEIDATAWLDARGDKKLDEMQKKYKELLDTANPLQLIGVNTEHTLATTACGGGGSFGKKTCGGGWPIPFNNDLLSPGSFHIMGCKPPGGGSNPFFPDFDGVPLFAVPTSGPIPVWPPTPVGAGGIPPFAGKNSQFRTYMTWTTSNGLGMSLCFGPYGATNFFPTPLGDIAGNCLVFATRLGPSCEGENPDGGPATILPYSTDDEVGASQVLEPGDRDLYEGGVCDTRATSMSPIVSDVLGGRVATVGSISSVNYTKSLQEQEYLQGAKEIQLEIEGGSVKGIVQCIVRKRVENQARYIANNALNMHISLVLPNIDTLRENIDQVASISNTQQFQLNWKTSTNPNQSPQQVSGPRGLDRVMNDVSGNPFAKIAQFFDSVPLVNFEEKNVSVEVPLIYVDELRRYRYLTDTWLTRNEKIINDREQSRERTSEVFSLLGNQQLTESQLRQLAGDELTDDEISQLITMIPQQQQQYLAGKLTNDQTLQRLQQTQMIAEMRRAVNAVRRNLQTLKQYEQLPKDLYELVHSSDQYVSEVIGFVQSVLGYITGWLQDNAQRFSLRVDAIITIKGILETRQLLIDFSVQRQSKCAKCRQDNYDFYSCKLKLLCIDLPILPIPPFSLPDILIDLSQVNLGIDIALPYFNFVPRKLTLPQLPDLPQVPGIDGNIGVAIRIPEIAILPPPPPLPELPRLDLNAQIQLPSLPPAPKIPQISPAITGVIKIADLIGSFMCIFKGGIGLVSEENIKARVEQLTQRSQNIMPFDALEITIPQAPLEGFNYRVDAVVDFKADFRQLYEVFDDLSLQWSMRLDNQKDGVRDTIVDVAGADSFEDVINDPVTQGVLNSDTGLGNDINLDINLQGNAWSPDDVSSLLASKRSLPHVGGTVQEVKHHLLGGLKTVLADSRLSYLHDQADRIVHLLTTTRYISPNVQGIADAGSQATEWLQERRDGYASHKLLLQSYDTFLDTIGGYVLTDTKVRDHLKIGVPLYETDHETIRLIAGQEAPMHTYLKYNQQLLQGYESALASNTPDQLRMSSVQHRYLTDQVTNLRQSITQALGDGPRLMQRNNQLDQGNDGGGGRGSGSSGPSRESPSTLIDMTQFIEGFFVKGEDGNYHSIVKPQSLGSLRHDQHTYHTADLNNDSLPDIVAWTDNQIHIKYANQKTTGPRVPGPTGAWIVLGGFGTPQAINDATSQTQGRYGDWKIRDQHRHTGSFARQGQQYASMSWSWHTDPSHAGYLIEVTERLTTSQYRQRGSSVRTDPDRTRYLLVVPEGTIIDDEMTVQVDERNQAYRISDLQDQGVIIEVAEYDGHSDTASAVLKNQSQRWSYARHAVLSTSSTGWIKSSPWSHSEVAGAQIWGDSVPPTVGVSLVRDITDQEVSIGYDLVGYINTTYTLDIEREDNGVVLHNRVVVDGDVVKIEPGEQLQIDAIEYTQPRTDTLLLVGVDQAGNIGQQEITIQFLVPDLEIDQIDIQEDGTRIVTQLNQTIDRGQVRFQRNRYGYWEPLDPDEFGITPTDPTIVGQIYSRQPTVVPVGAVPVDAQTNQNQNEQLQEGLSLDPGAPGGEISSSQTQTQGGSNEGRTGNGSTDVSDQSAPGDDQSQSSGVSGESTDEDVSTPLSIGSSSEAGNDDTLGSSDQSGSGGSVNGGDGDGGRGIPSDSNQNAGTPTDLTDGNLQLVFTDEQGDPYTVLLNSDQGRRIAPPVANDGHEVVPLGSHESLGVYRDGWCLRQLGMLGCIVVISVYGDVFIDEPYRYWLDAEVFLDPQDRIAQVVRYRDEVVIGEYSFRWYE